MKRTLKEKIEYKSKRNMVNFPNTSYVVKIGEPLHYNHIKRHGRHYPIQHHPPLYHPLDDLPLHHHNPIYKQTLERILELTPLIEQLNVHDKDLAHTPSKDVMAIHDHDFHINLDVGQYRAEDLSVKIISDHLVIQGKHDERKADDIGYVTRHFIRRYELPKDYNPDDMISKLSADGVLSVSLLPKNTEGPKQHIVTIHQADVDKRCLPKNKSINKNKDEDEDKESELEEDVEKK